MMFMTEAQKEGFIHHSFSSCEYSSYQELRKLVGLPAIIEGEVVSVEIHPEPTINWWGIDRTDFMYAYRNQPDPKAFRITGVFNE
jgi:hypothetical protein